MDPVTLLGLGALAVLALRKGRAPAVQQQPSRTELSPPSSGALANFKPPDLSGIIPDGAKGVLETVGKTLAAGAAGVIGAVGGETVGNELGNVFGLDPKGPAAITLRVGLGIVSAASLALGTAVALNLFGAAVLGATFVLAATGIGLVAVAAVFVVVVAIEDANRLAWARDGGAIKELQAEHNKVLDRFRVELRAQRDAGARVRDELLSRCMQEPSRLPDKDRKRLELAAGMASLRDTDIERRARQMAAAYCQERNLLKFENWMSRDRGIGVDINYHAKFGFDRGMFVGQVAGAQLVPRVQPDWPNINDVLPRRRYVFVELPVTPEMIPPADLETLTVQRIVHEPVYEDQTTTEVQKNLTIAAKSGTLTSFKSGGTVTQPTTTTVTKTIRVLVGTRAVLTTHPYQHDKSEWEWFDSGELVANVVSFMEWMEERHGVGLDDVAHAQYGLKHKKFRGSLSGARLVYPARQRDGSTRDVIIDHKLGVMSAEGAD